GWDSFSAPAILNNRLENGAGVGRRLTMHTRPNIDRLILDIHAAPLEPDRWQQVVETMRNALNADRAFLFSVPTRRAEEFWNVGSEMDPAIGHEYGQEFAAEDVWMLE